MPWLSVINYLLGDNPMIVLEAILGLALLKALAILCTLSCCKFYRVLGYDLWVDLLVGFGLLAIYHGSAHGMLVATLAGVVISIVLRATRWLIGYEKWSWRRRQWEFYYR
jgi:hypothetical protein